MFMTWLHCTIAKYAYGHFDDNFRSQHPVKMRRDICACMFSVIHVGPGALFGLRQCTGAVLASLTALSGQLAHYMVLSYIQFKSQWGLVGHLRSRNFTSFPAT